MMKNEKSLALYRLLFGLLGLSAVVTEIVTLVGRGTFAPANFFSFFTIQSNLLAVAVLLAGGLLIMFGKAGVPAFWRGAVTLYMVVTGIIFALLLSGLDANALTAVPWDNTVLHYIMPIAVFADWLLDRQGGRIAFRRALLWLLYPLAYLCYTLIRGHFVGWYPYPFLNVTEKGYVAVGIASAVVTVVVVGLVWIVLRTGRNR
jgi:hypothetical protein